MKKTLLLLTILMTLSASAHLEGGIDIPTDDYIIDIGHDPSELTTNKATFILMDLKKDEQVVNASSLFVRISDDKNTILAVKLLPESTQTFSLTTIFPHNGEYEIFLRFYTDNGIIENKAILAVGSPNYYLWTVVIFISMLFLGFLWKKFSRCC